MIYHGKVTKTFNLALKANIQYYRFFDGHEQTPKSISFKCEAISLTRTSVSSGEFIYTKNDDGCFA